MPLNLYLISIIAFVSVLGAFLCKKRKRIEWKWIILMARFERGKKLFDQTAKKLPAFWDRFGTIGIFVSLGAMIAGFSLLIFSLQQALLAPPGARPPIALVVPAPSPRPEIGYGFIAIPFWKFIISVGLLIVVHEGLHGILMRTVGVKIKSFGLALLAIIPGAFVEPDEEQIKQKGWKEKLKIFSVGSFGNLILAGLVAAFLLGFYAPTFYQRGVAFSYLNASKFNRSKPFPAQLMNLSSPILSINDERVRTPQELSEALKGKSPGELIQIKTLEGITKLQLTHDPKNATRGFIGIGVIGSIKILKPSLRKSLIAGPLNFLAGLLGWVLILNLFVGIFNMLPIKPLDGGHVLETLAKRFWPKKADKICRYAQMAVLALIFSIILISVS